MLFFFLDKVRLLHYSCILMQHVLWGDFGERGTAPRSSLKPLFDCGLVRWDGDEDTLIFLIDFSVLD